MDDLPRNQVFKGEWLDEIPMDWEQRKIKHLFSIKKEIAGELGHEVISITQRGAKLKDTESGEGQLSMDYSKYQIVKRGDFLMNHMDLLTGYVDISEFDGVTSPDYRVFVSSNIDVHSPYFLYVFQHCYKSKIFYGYGRGSSHLGRWRFPTVEFEGFYLPVPTPDEQKLVARYLNKKTRQIDSLIENIQKKIELLREQRSSIIEQFITSGLDPDVEMKDSGVEWIGKIPKGWNTKKISWITSLVTQGGNPDYSLGEVSDNFRVLKTKNLYDDKIYYDTADSISETTFLKETRSIPEQGDLLVAIVGKGSIGKVNIFDPPDDKKYIYSRSLGCIRFFEEEMSVIYAKWLFNSFLGKQILDLGIGGSTGQEVLKTTYLSNLRVPIPSLHEQKQISEHLEHKTSRVDKVISAESKRIKLLKEYRQSLISSVVTGKVRIMEDMI